MNRLILNRQSVSSLVVLAGVVVMLAWSFTYTGRQAAFPLIVCWLMLGLGIIDVIQHMLGKGIEDDTDAAKAMHTHGEGAAPIVKQVMTIVWLAGFIGLIYLVGFLAAIPLYVFAFMMLAGRMGLMRSALTAVFTTAFVYLMFIQLLALRLDGGLLFG